MKSKDYWQKRFELLESMQHDQAVESYNRISAQYAKAIDDTEKEIAKWYTRYATANGVTFQEAQRLLNGRELAEFRMSVKEYIKKGESLKYTDKWVKQLEAASAKVHVSRLQAMQLQMQQQAEKLYGFTSNGIDEMARKVYSDGYHHAAFEVHKGLGIGHDFAQLDTRKINKVLATPWASDGSNFSARVWKNRTQLVSELESTFTQGIIRGLSPQKTINVIAERMQVSKGRVKRLVLTESAYFASAATKDAFKELGVEQFEVVATLDSRTTETCRHMDGKVFEMKDYKPGTTAPPFHVFCRSTTVPYFDDELTEGDERAARDEDGKYYTVPSNMKYEDWYKVFIDKSDTMDAWKAAHLISKATSAAMIVNTPVAPVENVEVPVTKDEKQAVDYYVSGDGMYINHYLRDGNKAIEAMGEMRPEDKMLISDLDKATDRIVKHKTLYRSVDASAVFGDMSDSTYENLKNSLVYNDTSRFAKAAQEMANNVKGKVLIDKGFMSTSKSYDLIKDFDDFTGSDKPIILELKTSKTSKGFDLGKHMPALNNQMGQDEVLLSRNQKYKILSIGAKDGNIYVKAELQEMTDILPKTGGSGIINYKKSFTKIKVEDIPSMDKAKFSRMKKNIEKMGIKIVQDVEGDGYLNYMKAEAMTFSDGSAIIFRSDRIPSASAMFEEVIHVSQIKKKGMLTEYGSKEAEIEYLQREIEANEKMVKLHKEYGLTDIDLKTIKINLENYQKAMKAVKKNV